MAGIFLTSSVQILRQVWREYREDGGQGHASRGFGGTAIGAGPSEPA